MFNELYFTTTSSDGSLQYTCLKCLQLFSTKHLLIKHIFSHEQSINKPLNICQECGLVFLNLRRLSGHSILHNKKIAFKESSTFELKCAFCGQTFQSWFSLTYHVFKHVSAICSPVNKNSSGIHLHKYTTTSQKRYNLLDNITTYKEQSYFVRLVDAVIKEEPSQNYNYNNSQIAKTLTTIGTYKQPFVSNISGKSFSQCNELRVDRRFSCGERPFVCDICGKSYTANSSLRTHKRTHSGVRPFSCDVCRKDFTQSSCLKNHRRVHTDERAYACEVCGKTFRDCINLTTHKLNHQGERPFTCEVCGKTFPRADTLKEHKRIHSDERLFVCSFCGKSFKQTGCLRQHKRIHYAARLIDCKVCGKPFTHPSNLRRHIRLHTGERPFVCEICGKSFIRSRDLRKHKTIH